MSTGLSLPGNPSLQKWYRNRAIQNIINSEPFGWSSLVTQQAFNFTDEVVHSPLLNVYSLVCIISGTAYGTGRVMGDIYETTFIPGSLILIPPNDLSTGRWSSSTTGGIIMLAPEIFAHFADDAYHGDPAHIRLSSQINFFDPLLATLMRELCRELHETNPYGALFADSISNTIALHLLRRYSNVSVTLPTQRRKFTAWQSKMINDFIQDHLDQKITLDDLAHAIHISVPHFERLFRATYQRPPYHYVIECRIERAKALLGEGKISLFEIARYCGFASQSHLTRHFTRMSGVSPARFANRLKGGSYLTNEEGWAKNDGNG